MATLPEVTVTGTLYDSETGELYDGTIWLKMPVLLKHTDGTAIAPSTKTYAVVDGVVELPLYFVDAPGWGPVDWTWELRIRNGSVWNYYGIRPSIEDPDDVNLGDLIITDYTPSAGNDFALTGHTHPADVSDADLVLALEALRQEQRNLVTGELVLPRGEVNAPVPMLTGKLYLTHFKAIKTETVLTAHTDCGAAAVGAQHAWIGFMKWTGTQYTLDSVSVDDPTRWASAGSHYPTQIFQTDDAHFGAADLTRPGFNKVAGQNYAEFRLWVGSGSAPTTWGGFRVPADSGVEPRRNMTMDLVAPPSSSLQAEWVVGSTQQHQARMMP